MTVHFDGLCFVDTNVWLYAFIADQDEGKHGVAKQIIETQSIVVSVQVINEIAVNLLKKTALGETEIQDLVQSFYSRYPVVGFDKEVLIDASRLRNQFSLSFWDSLIVASARYSGADFLLTEDMQHGLVVGQGLHIVNPFRSER